MCNRCVWKYGPNSPPTSGPSSQSSPSQRRESMVMPMASSVERFRSVSSIRRMKLPPWCRANSQLNKAVRAVPTWMYPVGAGAMRHRTGASGTRRHPVLEDPDPLDLHLDRVTGLDRSDSGGRSGEDDVTRKQRHDARDVLDELTRAERELRGPPGLARHDAASG